MSTTNSINTAIHNNVTDGKVFRCGNKKFQTTNE